MRAMRIAGQREWLAHTPLTIALPHAAQDTSGDAGQDRSVVCCSLRYCLAGDLGWTATPSAYQILKEG